MRLIDADKLKYSATIIQDTKYEEGNIIYWVGKSDIENAPTIEAIPVKWLIKHIMIGNEFATTVIDIWRKENENENIS